MVIERERCLGQVSFTAERRTGRTITKNFFSSRLAQVERATFIHVHTYFPLDEKQKRSVLPRFICSHVR